MDNNERGFDKAKLPTLPIDVALHSSASKTATISFLAPLLALFCSNDNAGQGDNVDIGS